MNAYQPARYRRPALWMLALGILAALAGATGMRQWDALAPPTQIYYSLSIAAGVALIVCGAWVMSNQWLSPAAAWISLAAAFLLGVNQLLALWYGNTLCYTAACLGQDAALGGGFLLLAGISWRETLRKR
jgi:uncharacterized integral membrane protein